MSDVTITLFSDPLSPAAYRRRAVRSQLEYVFDDVEFRYRCVVSVPEATDDVFSEVADELSDLRSASTMPVADSLTAEDLPSSWAACEAIAAARAYVVDEWEIDADEVARGFERIESSLVQTGLDEWT